MRVRRKTDGQLGVVVTGADGTKQVRLDRGRKVNADAVTIPYRENDWMPDKESGPNAFQVARLLYAIDREYRLTLGGEFRVPEWTHLDERVRAGGFRLPEDANDTRKRLHAAVRAALGQ